MIISFVIPCYNSSNTVEIVINSIIQIVSEKPEYDYEIIAVNDCSPDNVIEVLKRIAADNHKIKVIDLATNVGKHAAVLAGYSVVKGEYVVSLDDDGQCPVDRLWDLITPLEQGHDMAMAKYNVRKESFLKRLGSKVNNKMSKVLIGKPESLIFSNFIARKKFVCENMCRYHNPYPYLEGLSIKTTGDIVLVPMEENERISGSSGYTLKKSLKLWINGFTAFSVRPLRMASFIGLVFSLIGLIFGIVLIINKIINPSVAVGYSSMMVTLLFIGGVLMVMLGMLGEYIGRIYISINHISQYVIREKINIDDNKTE